jgi:hypothetical protein
LDHRVAADWIESDGESLGREDSSCRKTSEGFSANGRSASCFAALVVGVLWFGFSLDYATTRDVYFTVAIAHVLAEAPFLLRML